MQVKDRVWIVSDGEGEGPDSRLGEPGTVIGFGVDSGGDAPFVVVLVQLDNPVRLARDNVTVWIVAMTPGRLRLMPKEMP